MLRMLRFGAWGLVAWLLGSCGFGIDIGDGAAGRPAVGVTSAALSAPPESSSCSSYVHLGRQYWICTSSKSWSVARQKCIAVGLDLAAIESQDENDFIRSKLVADAWVGGSDQDSEGVWRWGDPVTGVHFWQGNYNGTAVGNAYENWDSFEPGGSSTDCLELERFSGEWEDHSCGLSFDYVCEGPEDQCPMDPAKDSPGQCGCGNPDTDTDGDGVADCIDECIDDPDKSEAGDCGCGVPDDDSDGDGTADCADECDEDPDRTEPPCSPDSDCEYVPFAGSHYFFCDNRRDWQSAKTRCESVGLKLARINDAAENNFIKQRIGNDYWIGGSDSAIEGWWVWDSGNDPFWQGDEDGSVVGGRYENWNFGQPNNLGGEDCLQIEGDGDWWDDDCDDTEQFICEEDERDKRIRDLRELMDERFESLGDVVAVTTTSMGTSYAWIPVPIDLAITDPPPAPSPLDDLEGVPTDEVPFPVPETAAITMAQSDLALEPAAHGPAGTYPVWLPDIDALEAMQFPPTVEEFLGKVNPRDPGSDCEVAGSGFPEPGLTCERAYAGTGQLATEGSGLFRGIYGVINVWNAFVPDGDSSIVEGALTRGMQGLRQTVEAGAVEGAAFFADGQTHFFVYFTTDGHLTLDGVAGGYAHMVGFPSKFRPLFPGANNFPPGAALVTSGETVTVQPPAFFAGGIDRSARA